MTTILKISTFFLCFCLILGNALGFEYLSQTEDKPGDDDTIDDDDDVVTDDDDDIVDDDDDAADDDTTQEDDDDNDSDTEPLPEEEGFGYAEFNSGGICGC